MLHLDKLKFYFLILIFSIYSCDYKRNEREKKEKLIYGTSLGIMKKKEYDNVLYKAKDSLNFWIKNGLHFYDKYQKIDSLICFNKNKNRCVMALLDSSPEGIYDGIHYFYGAKFNNKWYFFGGATIYLPREFYQKDIHQPLSFEKIHEIALDEVYSGYLKKKDKGFWANLFGKTEWELNDDFFGELDKPNVPFEERKTEPNSHYSCRDINNKREYEECAFIHDALRVWNEDSTSVTKDTYLYSPEFPVTKKIRQLKKGDLLSVIERIDNSQWCCVRMWDGIPYVGFIEKEAIAKRKKIDSGK
jgi:hypothetical protein